MSDTCITCKRKISNMSGSTHYPCPNCHKHQITRCLDCRTIAARYTCPECSFSGPN
ncbi:MAG: zinc finger domain-containing protein [Nanoarchaeota archaeon]|nr:zinc finger domain-containing protein [Nanoarchaeota archaeon]